MIVSLFYISQIALQNPHRRERSLAPKSYETKISKDFIVEEIITMTNSEFNNQYFEEVDDLYDAFGVNQEQIVLNADGTVNLAY